MKSDMLTIIRKELARFFKDKRMVFTTILMPGLLIYLIYTFMGEAMMNQFETSDTYVANAYVQNMPKEIEPILYSLSADWKEASDQDIASIKQSITDKAVDVLICFPADFSQRISSYEPGAGGTVPMVEIWYNSTESESANLYGILYEILDAYEASLVNVFDVNTAQDSYDLATQEDVSAQIFAMLLPMLLMTFLFSGCISIAPESIAGEKERGTIATLLVTPMKRRSLALGKIISISFIALLSGVSSFLGTMLSLPKLTGGAEVGMDVSLYGVVDYLMLACVILTTVLVLVSLISIVSTFAKSIKEAGTAVSPLMIFVMVISLTPLFSTGAKRLGIFAIPIYNSVQCMHGVFSFSYEPLQIVVTCLCNLVYAGLLSFVLTRLFNSEKVMFSK